MGDDQVAARRMGAVPIGPFDLEQGELSRQFQPKGSAVHPGREDDDLTHCHEYIAVTSLCV